MNNVTSALHGSAIKPDLHVNLKAGITGALVLAPFALAAAVVATEENWETLPVTTVIANRTETDLSKVGSAVSILDVDALDQEGIRHLDDALRFVPGVISESISGQRGSGSSLLLRGTITSHAHVRVDGVRLTGANISTSSFLGGSNLNGLSRIEILRGPQSALYGGDAIGGVIGLYSKKGTGEPGGRLRVEGGSFDSFSTLLELQGRIDQFSYALSLGYETTQNDLPNNAFEQFSTSLRLDYGVNDVLNIGLTLRAFDSDFRRPDYSDPEFSRNADDDTRSILATLFADLKVNEIWTSRLTLGIYDEEYGSQTYDSPNYYETDGRKLATYWDNTIRWNDRHTTVTGAVYEETDYSYASLFFGLTEDSRTSSQYGFYLNHTWDATEALTLNGGARWEDYDTYGDEATWRFSAAYRVDRTNTKFRSSVGKGFRPPSFIEFHGFGGGSDFDLLAEESIGWDVGVDQEFCDGQYAINVTYFDNDIENLIDSVWDPDTFTSIYFNVPGTTRTNGIEVAASGHWLDDRLHAVLSYTWLDQKLSGQPANSAGLRVNSNITTALDAGFSIVYLDSRPWTGDTLDAYTLANLHATYAINQNVALNARVTNLFDENFAYYSGFGEIYPGRGRGIFAGLTILW